MRFDVLLHELGHHVLQHRARKLGAAQRRSDHERFAETFAAHWKPLAQDALERGTAGPSSQRLPGGDVAAEQGDGGDGGDADQDGGETDVEGRGAAVVAHETGVQPGDQVRHPQLSWVAFGTPIMTERNRPALSDGGA
jgi:hypothetical protein